METNVARGDGRIDLHSKELAGPVGVRGYLLGMATDAGRLPHQILSGLPRAQIAPHDHCNHIFDLLSKQQTAPMPNGIAHAHSPAGSKQECTGRCETKKAAYE